MAAKKNTTKKTTTKKKGPAIPQKTEYEGFSKPLFIHGIIWAALFVFTLLFIYMDSNALIAYATKSVCGGLFGAMAYLIPAVFAGTLIYLVYTHSISKMWSKFILLWCELADVAAIIGLFASYDAASAYDICSVYTSGGGAVGVGIASGMAGLISAIGAFIVLLILFVVIACFIVHVNITPYLITGIKKLLGFSTETAEKVRDSAADYAAKRRERKAYEEELLADESEIDDTRSARFAVPEDDTELPESLNSRIKKKSKPVKKQSEKANTSVRTIDIANDFAMDFGQNGDTSDDFNEELEDNGNDFDIYNMRFGEEEIDDNDFKHDNFEDELESEREGYESIEESGFDDDMFNTYGETQGSANTIKTAAEPVENKPKEKALSDDEKKDFGGELDNAMSAEVYEYNYPTLNLLNEAKKTTNDERQELYKKAEKLIAVLDNFGVKAKPVQVTQGPTVTRYEIQPSSGTKLSKIVGLADDIALNLAVSTVLIAPVPGKAATVGVEIPNTNVTPVTIKEMLESPEFVNAKSKLTVCLGKDIGGNVVVGDIAKWPHALIAGATGSGKSVCINTIVTSILYKADPNDVKLIMVDPKQVELGVYNGIPHLLIPVVTEAKKAAGALNWAVQEMMHRYELFKQTGVRKLEMYNKLMEKTGGEKIPQLVIIIDELADLMMVAAKEVEDYICRLAQLARAAGIHLIIATQRPSVDVITGLIKANIPSRIAFFVSSQVDSRTIIDKAGAEKLLGMGDMLYFPAGARSTRRVQGAFVSDEEVERIVDYIKDTSPETHYREDLAEHIERVQLGENGVTPDKDDDGDALLPDAIQLAIELGKISTSMVQRRLSVGYSRAGRIIDQMEKRGIISPANGSKPRDVLISHADMAGFDTMTEDNGYDEE